MLGLIVFLAFATFPFYYNIGKVNAKPELKTDTPAIQEWVQKYGKKECIESKEVHETRTYADLKQLEGFCCTERRQDLCEFVREKLHDESSEYLHELPFEQEEILRRMPQLYGCYALLLELPYRNRRRTCYEYK